MRLVVFQDKKIRRVWHKEEWYFSIVDIIHSLTDSPSPRQYWAVLKGRDPQLLTICLQLKLPSSDGKEYATDCTNTKNAFRLIQSVPSKKAEPFKQWLAQLGKERIEEIHNPELIQRRLRVSYEMKDYPKEWIEKRLRGMVIRHELTEEWKQRGVDEHTEFSILTNEISMAAFGKTIQEYKKFKGVKQNLRDHMTDWELILTMVGEKATTDITQAKDDEGFEKCKVSAKEGGEIAGSTRKALETKTGKPIVSGKNFLEKKTKEEENTTRKYLNAPRRMHLWDCSAIR